MEKKQLSNTCERRGLENKKKTFKSGSIAIIFECPSDFHGKEKRITLHPQLYTGLLITSFSLDQLNLLSASMIHRNN